MPPSTRGRLLAVCCLVLGLGLVTVAVGGLVTTVALGSPADEAGTATTPPRPADDLEIPGRTELEGPVTDGTTVAGVDVGGAIDRDSARLATAYERSRLNERLARADNASQREAILADAYAEANRTFRSLRDRERSVFQSYQAGRVDAEGVLVELRSIHVRAEAQSSMLDVIVARSDSINETYGDRANDLQSLYVARQGILREELGSIAAGQRSPRRYYVASSNDGVVLSRVGPEGFAREVVRDDLLLVGGGESRLAYDDVRDHVQGLYPTFAASHNFGLQNELGSHLVQFSGDHDDGRLEFFLDRDSGDVFREYQALDLDDDLPTIVAGTASADGVTLRLNRTYSTGPARVTVTETVEREVSGNQTSGTEDGASDETAGDDGATQTRTVTQPVDDAPVTIDGTEVARTDDGIAWVVLPYGQSEVNVSVDGRQLSTTVDWSAGGNQATGTDSSGDDPT